MGQRGNSAVLDVQVNSDPDAPVDSARLAVFLTDLGWFGLLGSGNVVRRLTIGHTTAQGVRRAVSAGRPENVQDDDCEESDWNPALRRQLERYAAGIPTEFDGWTIALPRRTEFQRNVIAATRALGYGQTASYGELAERVGVPRAARAVGSVMAANTVPILIPCHRVVGARGKLGGFSAPQGIRLKDRMLRMEAEALCNNRPAGWNG